MLRSTYARSAIALCALALLSLSTSLLPSRDARAKEAPAAATRAVVPVDHIHVDDGDSIRIDGPNGVEQVRLLGIDCPETQHLEHDIPSDQPGGLQARAFLEGCLAASTHAELLRSGQIDPFGRTLAYLFLGGRNYSVLVLRARHAIETVSRYGDNGLPTEAAACLAAGRTQGAVAFEDPRRFRRRMNKVAKRMKAAGTYPPIVGQR